MTASLQSIPASPGLLPQMVELGRRARAASRVLALVPTERKNAALAAMASAVRRAAHDIAGANAEDTAQARQAGATPAFVDRLLLDPQRIEAMAAGIEGVQALPD